MYTHRYMYNVDCYMYDCVCVCICIYIYIYIFMYTIHVFVSLCIHAVQQLDLSGILSESGWRTEAPACSLGSAYVLCERRMSSAY